MDLHRHERQTGPARPAQRILDVLAELASNPYERDENWNDAILAARVFTEDDIPQVLAAMVNRPPVPADKDALEWVSRIQLAA